MKTRIIYEDNDIIVCHKVAGFAVQSAKITSPDMVGELKAYLKRQSGSDYLGIIHRLDQPVEGIIVFAKNAKAAAILSKSVSGSGDMCKYYEAVICGHMDEKSGTLTDYIEKMDKNMARVVSADNQNGKKSILEYEVLDKSCFDSELMNYFEKDKNLTSEIERLGIHLKTGRFHQIRAQLANKGCPILGDSKYGTPQSISRAGELGIRRLFLKACSLSFIHPKTGEVVEFTV